MSKSRSQQSFAWSLLTLIPVVLVVVSLIPRLGRYSVGLGPEWFLHSMRGYPEFGETASGVWWAVIAVFTIAFAVAAAWWFATLRGWQSRLQTFEIAQVNSYSRFVAMRAAWTFITILMVAGAAIVASPALTAGGLSSWIIFAAIMGLLGVAQFFAFVCGAPKTLRLYRGY
jgi:hypothetical protein